MDLEMETDNKNIKMCACHSHVHTSHEESEEGGFINIIISAILLTIGLVYQGFFGGKFFENTYIKLFWYILAYLPVAIPVLRSSLALLREKDFFNEFTLMSIATIGAFAIKEYPEGVAVMLFYSIGEALQDRAVDKARKNIRSLVDTQKKNATILRNGIETEIAPEEVKIGDILQVKNGERILLDGKLTSSNGDFDSSAITGESVPVHLLDGMDVLSGMINKGALVTIEVTQVYEDSALSRIMALVEDAASRKSPKELIIRRFAKIYTPLVFLLALLVVIIPYFFNSPYIFSEWLYRGLVLLVISCPCALVISVPLAYYAGIGAASRKGILFKGANYLDTLKDVNTFVLDKTGTLTKGVFRVQEISNITNDSEFLGFAKLIESKSNHPIAKAIIEYRSDIPMSTAAMEQVEEKAGYGIKALVDNKVALAGNKRLLDANKISIPEEVEKIQESHVLFAYDGTYYGYIIVADEIKEDAKEFISQLKHAGIKDIEILSGDKQSIASKIGTELGVDKVLAELLPEQKMQRIEDLKKVKENTIAFVGDGINDTPAMALSDIGITMGGIGADSAIEVADIIIQNDKPSYINKAIKIAKETNRVVIFNIIFAIAVKIAVIVWGIFGNASLWEAVFADVGVTILAVINSMRILFQNK